MIYLRKYLVPFIYLAVELLEFTTASTTRKMTTLSIKSKNYTQATKSPKQETPKESKQQDGLYKIIPFFALLNSKILCVKFVCNFVTVGKLKDNTPGPGCSKQG